MSYLPCDEPQCKGAGYPPSARLLCASVPRPPRPGGAWRLRLFYCSSTLRGMV